MAVKTERERERERERETDRQTETQRVLAMVMAHCGFGKRPKICSLVDLRLNKLKAALASVQIS